MFPLAQVRKAGSEVISEEEEFGVGLSECGCPQEARLGLPHSQSPSPSRGKVSHPLPAEGKSAECRSCHFTSLAAFAPVSMAEHTYLGHHRGHFFFSQLKNKNKNKSIHSHLSKRENSVAGGHSKTQRSQKEYVLPDPESVQNPRRAFSPPPHPYFSTHRCPFPWHTGFLHTPLHPGENGCSSPSARTSQRWLATDTD